MKTRDENVAPLAGICGLTSSKLTIISGFIVVCYFIACKMNIFDWRQEYVSYSDIQDVVFAGVTVGLVHLDSCPRHPVLSVWLLTMGLVFSVISPCLITLPVCNIGNLINIVKDGVNKHLKVQHKPTLSFWNISKEKAQQ